MKSISIHLTDTCNNSCQFCVVGSHQGSTEKVNQVMINEFLEMNAGKGYISVNIHGGEPTLVPEIFSILEKIKELEYPTISIQTNGRLLSDMGFAKELTSRGADLFVISLHGKDAEMHDFYTQVKGSFDEAVAGIRNVKALGKKVRTNTCVCKQNAPYLSEIVTYSLDQGTDHINISNLHTTGKAFVNFHDMVPRVNDVVSYVKEATDTVVARDKVVTLEGYSACMLGEYKKYMIDWDEVNFKLLYRTFILEDYAKFMSKETKKQGKPCKECIEKRNCGGIYKEYAMIYGWDEFSPVK